MRHGLAFVGIFKFVQEAQFVGAGEGSCAEQSCVLGVCNGLGIIQRPFAMRRLSGQPAQAAERSESLEGGWLDSDLSQAIEQGTDIAIIFPDARPASTTG